jgi:hypothetical protein
MAPSPVDLHQVAQRADVQSHHASCESFDATTLTATDFAAPERVIRHML